MGELVNGCLSNVLFTAAVGVQMSGLEPSIFRLSVFCFRFVSVLFFWAGHGD